MVLVYVFKGKPERCDDDHEDGVTTAYENSEYLLDYVCDTQWGLECYYAHFTDD